MIGWVRAERGRTNSFVAASLILSTFASLKPLILERLRFVVAWTAYSVRSPNARYSARYKKRRIGWCGMAYVELAGSGALGGRVC